MESNAEENGVIPSEDEWSPPSPHDVVPVWEDGELAWRDEQGDDEEDKEMPT